MDQTFQQHLFNRQYRKQAVPSNEIIASWASDVIAVLFPEVSDRSFSTAEAVADELKALEQKLIHLLNATKACCNCNNEEVARNFFLQLSEILRVLSTD